MASPHVLTLYDYAISVIVDDFHNQRCDVKQILPDNVLFDVYFKMYNNGNKCMLGIDLQSLQTFNRLLSILDKHRQLHQMFQALVDHGVKMGRALSTQYITTIRQLPKDNRIKHVQSGLTLGEYRQNTFQICEWL